MNLSKWVIVLGVAILVAVTGCAATNVTTQRIASSNHVDVSHPRAELVVASKDLYKKLKLTNLRFGNVGIFPRMQLALQNTSNDKLILEYKIEWQDAQGFAVNNNNAWHRFTLTPRQIQNIQSVGKVPEAYSVQVMTRFPDDIFIDAHKRREQEQQEQAEWHKL